MVGNSAAATGLRRHLQAAEHCLRKGSGVVLVGHDPGEAALLAQHLASRAQGAWPGAPAVAVQPWSAEGVDHPAILVARPEDEMEAYTQAPASWAVVDVPPLWERSMDLPYIALDILQYLHSSLERPGAPRAFSQQAQDLRWLSRCWWPGGRDQLQAYLERRLNADALAVWTGPDDACQPLPAALHPAMLAQEHVLDVDCIRAQSVLWARGVYSHQEDALRNSGITAANLPKWLFVTLRPNGRRQSLWPGPPRRLRWREDGFVDPWQGVAGSPRSRSRLNS